jgi:5-(carboxyamino)imidazole ribonucleotide mutase
MKNRMLLDPCFLFSRYGNFKKMKVAILFGSMSDAPIMKKAAGVLREFGITCTAHAISAHRSPELLAETIRSLETEGTEVIIAGAGLAAHLPGVIASQTLIPVIGVPISSGGLGGLDALLSIVQMPKPVPVAAVGVDNAANAAYLVCEMLALKYPVIKEKLIAFRQQMKDELAKDSGKVEL